MTGRPAAAMIAAMKTVLGLALLVTVACGSAGAPRSPSPSTAGASASTSPTPAATPLTSQRVHLGLRGTFALSPDARTILFFDFRASAGPAPFVLDVATDTARALVPAPASDGPFVYGGWLADGRLLLVGKKVWLGDARGEGLRIVAHATAPAGRPDVPGPSPDARAAL